MGLFSFLGGAGRRPDWVPSGRRGKTGGWVLVENGNGTKRAMRPRQGWGKVAAMYRKMGSGHHMPVSSEWSVVGRYGEGTDEPDSVKQARDRAYKAIERRADRARKRGESARKRQQTRATAEENARREHSVMEQIEASYRRGRL